MATHMSREAAAAAWAPSSDDPAGTARRAARGRASGSRGPRVPEPM